MSYARALRLFQQHLPQDTFRPQPASDWLGPDPLPAEIAAYYAHVGPVDVELPMFAYPIFLPPLRDLWSDQEPYQYDITTGEPEPTWRESWFFLADLEDVAYRELVFDSTTGQVLNVTYDEPGWVAIPLMRDLETLALALAILTTPVADPQDATHAADVQTILDQLRAFLSAAEVRTLLTELHWQYTPPDL